MILRHLMLRAFNHTSHSRVRLALREICSTYVDTTSTVSSKPHRVEAGLRT